jgi:probable phosphoglycerate mutase
MRRVAITRGDPVDMSEPLPAVYLARHGETGWSQTGQHTGLTDLPLTAHGERQAAALAARLRGVAFAAVFASPLRRAARTCALAGFADRAVTVADLVEWDYGAYEGKRTADIRAARPDWNLFRDGCPDGETAVDVGARADRVLARVRASAGNVLLFSSGHILRVLAARWLGLPPEGGRFLTLGTAGVSILGFEHDRSEPVIALWNEPCHIAE